MSELKSPLRKPVPEIAGIAHLQLGHKTIVFKLFNLDSRLPDKLKVLPGIAGTTELVNTIPHEHTSRSRL